MTAILTLTPSEIAGIADAYLDHLATNADARASLAAARSHGEVAERLSNVVGVAVTEGDVEAIAEYLGQSRAPECEALAARFPALGSVIEASR